MKMTIVDSFRLRCKAEQENLPITEDTIEARLKQHGLRSTPVLSARRVLRDDCALYIVPLSAIIKIPSREPDTLG